MDDAATGSVLCTTTTPALTARSESLPLSLRRVARRQSRRDEAAGTGGYERLDRGPIAAGIGVGDVDPRQFVHCGQMKAVSGPESRSGRR